MRLFTPRAAKWLRGSVVAGVAAGLAVSTGIAFGSLSGNAPGYTTNASDPVSAQVIRNGANNSSGGSTNDAEFQVCFNKQLQTIGAGTSSNNFLEHLELIGYGGYGGDNSPPSNSVAGFSPDQTVLLGSSFTLPYNSNSFTGSAATNPSNPNCVNVTLTPPAGQSGIDLNYFTQVAVDEGAGTAFNSLLSTPATVALTPLGTPEVAPRAGASTGPKLLSIAKSVASPTTLTYVFDYNVDPNAINAGDFCYYDSSGTEHCGSAVSGIAGNVVTIQFGANVNNDVYYEVYSGGVSTQTTGVENPTTARGGTIASVPTLQSVAAVPGVSGAYDLTYDQPVVANDDNKFRAVLEDNTVINGAVSSRPGTNSNMIRITFGSVANFADYASKVVKITDDHCAVKQQSTPNHCSALGEGAVSTPSNMQSGFSDGPNLIGFKVNSDGTAVYTFDSQYGALLRNSGLPLKDDFGLLFKDGTNSIDNASFPSQATFTGPNQVTVQFNPSQLGTTSNPVVAGIIGNADFSPTTSDEGSCNSVSSTPGTGCHGAFAVEDYQFKGNVSPLTSGIGTGTPPGTTSTGSTSTGSTSTNTTVTSTRTSTSTRTTSTSGGGKKHFLGRLLLVGRRLKVANDQVTARFKCDSSQSCSGLFSITFHVKSKHHRTVTAVCTVSRSAKYSIPAHATNSVTVPIHGYCTADVQRHHGHLHGKLTTRPRTAQQGIVAGVTLVL